jgi:coenzyme F420-0:L-glutamate ligase/coenzyme F420-1:gamma-L-glutamate ligase
VHARQPGDADPAAAGRARPAVGAGVRVSAGALTVLPVAGMPEIGEGDDLAALIAERAELHDGDVVLVASKIVSKAEGAVVVPRAGETRAEVLARAVADQATRVVASAPWVTIVETHHGFVCANAGVDASNVAGDAVVVLPADPDASAAVLRAGLRVRRGVEVGVIITDTFGRPWREGQTEVALGVAGVPALRSEIGGDDRHGRTLQVTEAAIADELAGAADLVRDKGAGVPVVIVRGLAFAPDDGASGRDLLRPAETDLFRRGRGGLTAALVSEPARFAGPVDHRDLWTVQAAVEAICGGGIRIRARRPDDRQPGTELVVDADAPSLAGVAAGVTIALLVDLGYGAVLVEASAVLTIRAGRPGAGA